MPACRSGPVLTNLDLGVNNIGAEGAKAIANSLKSGMAVLKNLSVAYNNIHGEAAQQLAPERQQRWAASCRSRCALRGAHQGAA